MNPSTQRIRIDGPAGELEVAVNDPGERRGIAVVAHPHPLHGGTLDNKVAQTLAKAFVALGLVALRPNFRGVGASAGSYDAGRGEVDDILAVVAHARREFGERPLWLAGFSFGGFVQTHVAERAGAERLVLVAPAVESFEARPVPAATTLLVHGESDDVVPLSAVLDWARPQALPVVVLPGAGHFFHGRLVDLQRVIADFCRGALAG